MRREVLKRQAHTADFQAMVKIKHFKIGKKLVGDNQPCFIIAEVGSNHNGDITLAKRLILAAAEAGADAVKFQLFTAEKLSSEKKTQRILRKYEFDRSWLYSLNEFALKQGVIFFATPFDREAVDLLSGVNVPVFKISSGDLTNVPLIKYVAKQHKPVILSVGLGTKREIKEALQCIYSTGNRNIVLLRCVVDYPAKLEDLNLRAIHTLKQWFKIPVGFSDHTMDVAIPSVGVVMGASVIEKHFTLSRNMKGPDHSFALEPDEFKAMVGMIRNARKSLGSDVKMMSISEKKNIMPARRSLYACKYIAKGSIIHDDAVVALRPRISIEPKYLDRVIGSRAIRDMAPFQPIQWRDLTVFNR